MTSPTEGPPADDPPPENPSGPPADQYDGHQDDELARWRRLDARLVLAVPLLVLTPLIPALLVMVLSSAQPSTIGSTALSWLGLAAVLTAFSGVDWFVTWYRVTTERFELRKGLLTRNHRSIPRDRIRSVDLTANPAHRVLGLMTVNIGTGEQSEGGDLKLDALARRDAERLRLVLLGQLSTAVEAPTDGTIVRMRTRWYGYSMLTLSLIFAVWGAIVSALGSFQEILSAWGVFGTVGSLASSLPLWVVIAVPAFTGLVVGLLGSLLVSVEQWWRFELTREQDGTLRVRRGLLTTRAVSLEENRLRGAELVEPLLLRSTRGARLSAVTTGLGGTAGRNGPERSALLPPAPKAEALRVAARVLQQPWPSTPLRRHPRAALRRRFVWSFGTVLPVLAALAIVSWQGWVPLPVTGLLALGTLVVAGSFAVNAYRNLGHLLTEDFLLPRAGTVVRRTVALRRSGIIGWRVRQTWFQRRSGLLTVGVTTAAGSSHYQVRDVAVEDGWVLADEAVPGLLAPFRDPQ